MADYVVDATVVIEYVVTGIYTSNAKAFFKQISMEDHIVVPEFCLLECTNVIWRQVRFQGMPRQTANQLLRAVRQLKFDRAPVKHLLQKALDIGLDNQLAVYDSAYIALAQHYQYPFISLDQPQSRVAHEHGISLKLLTDFV